MLQFICPGALYGAEKWILALAKYLDPHIIGCKLATTQESDGQVIEIHETFQSLGLDSYRIRMLGRFDPLGILRLCRLIRAENIDIIHTHGYKSDIIGVIAARIMGIKAVATPHGFDKSDDLKLKIYIHLGCMALRYFDRVVPLSQELKSDMEKIKINPMKLRLINNGVDLEEIEAERKRECSGIDKGLEKKIAYIGQMIFRKNVGDLIRVFDSLYNEYKDIRLILVGDGPDREELEKLSKSMASSPQIEFMGYRHDPLRLLKEVDLFSMTSRLEGIPRCLMEAMAMEVPVAAYDIPGVDQLIIYGQTGLLAKFGDVEGLKQCWAKILFDEKFSSEMTRNGRIHILNNFSAKRMADEYMNLYLETIADDKSTTPEPGAPVS